MRFSTSRWRISGIAGLLFVVLSLVASGMNVQPPSYDQAPAAFVAWFAESSQRFRIGHFIAGIAFLLFYSFVRKRRAASSALAVAGRSPGNTEKTTSPGRGGRSASAAIPT